MAVPQYLLQNSDNIKNHHQIYNEWIDLYQEYNNDNYTVVQKIYIKYNTENVLNRDAIKDIYRNCNEDDLDSYFFAFISTIVWGSYINSGGPIPRRKIQFESFFKSKEEIINKVKSIKSLLSEGNLEDAYNSLLTGGKNKIENIATAFFTKILYFGSVWIPTNYKASMPLIFDSVQMRNFYRLNRFDMDKNEYDYLPLFIAGTDKIRNSRDVNFEFYNLFINKYSKWAKELNLASEQIEAFTFGKKRTANDDNIYINHLPIMNPRTVIRNL
jgi:hypothetical protein